ERGDLERVALAAARQVVEIEEPLLVADRAGERAELHIRRRKPRRPELAQMVRGPRARVLGEDRARPMHAAPQHPARLLVVALRLQRAGVQVLALEHRGGARGGEREHQQGDDDRGAALRKWKMNSRASHLSAKSRLTRSPLASESSTATARGRGWPTGQTGTQVPSSRSAVSLMSATFASTAYAAAGGPASIPCGHRRYSTLPSRSR